MHFIACMKDCMHALTSIHMHTQVTWKPTNGEGEMLFDEYDTVLLAIGRYALTSECAVSAAGVNVTSSKKIQGTGAGKGSSPPPYPSPVPALPPSAHSTPHLETLTLHLCSTHSASLHPAACTPNIFCVLAGALNPKCSHATEGTSRRMWSTSTPSATSLRGALSSLLLLFRCPNLKPQAPNPSLTPLTPNSQIYPLFANQGMDRVLCCLSWLGT
jgi:hypothetical protein